MKYWASTWQDVRKSLQLFFCFILARWVIFSNNTFAQSVAIQRSWIVKATSLSTRSIGLYNICKDVYESQTWWQIQLTFLFVYYIEHHFNGVSANRLNQVWHQFNNSPGCRKYTEDAVLNMTYPEWLLYLSLQVYVISLPTHIKNNTVSCQSTSNQINSLIRCSKALMHEDAGCISQHFSSVCSEICGNWSTGVLISL